MAFRSKGGILQIIRMALGTMRLGQHAPGDGFASVLVLLSGDCFQMIGIDATAVSAEMVYLFAFWDRADEDFVDASMAVAHAAAKHDARVSCCVG